MGLKFADEISDARHEKTRDSDRCVDVRGVVREGHLPWPLYFLVPLKLPRLRRPSPIEVFFGRCTGAGDPESERFAIGIGVTGREVFELLAQLVDQDVDVDLS